MTNSELIANVRSDANRLRLAGHMYGRTVTEEMADIIERLEADLAALRAWVAAQPCSSPTSSFEYVSINGRPFVRNIPCGSENCPPCRERARRRSE